MTKILELQAAVVETPRDAKVSEKSYFICAGDASNGSEIFC